VDTLLSAGRSVITSIRGHRLWLPHVPVSSPPSPPVPTLPQAGGSSCGMQGSQPCWRLPRVQKSCSGLFICWDTAMIMSPAAWARMCPYSQNTFQHKIWEKNTNSPGASVCYICSKAKQSRLYKYLRTRKNWTGSKETSGTTDLRSRGFQWGSLREDEEQPAAMHPPGTAGNLPKLKCLLHTWAISKGPDQIKMLFLPLKCFISISNNRNSATVNSSDKIRIHLLLLCCLIWQEMDCWLCWALRILALVQRPNLGIPKKISYMFESMVFMKLPSWLTFGNRPSSSRTDTSGWAA
jgi:hypothetical protein